MRPLRLLLSACPGAAGSSSAYICSKTPSTASIAGALSCSPSLNLSPSEVGVSGRNGRMEPPLLAACKPVPPPGTVTAFMCKGPNDEPPPLEELSAATAPAVAFAILRALTWSSCTAVRSQARKMHAVARCMQSQLQRV